MAEEQIKAEALRNLIELHWQHCRHLESERAWFMNVYGAITAGVLTFMAGKDAEPSWPLYFLVVLTLFGFLHTVRWTFAFEHHRNRVNFFGGRILEDHTVMVNHNLLLMDIPKLWLEVFRTRYLFPLIYFLVLVLLVWVFEDWVRVMAISAIVIAVPSAVQYIRYLNRINSDYDETSS